MNFKIKRLQELHSLLLKAKYFYYEKHESIMSDFEFDMLEKEYTKLVEEFCIDDNHSLVNTVGFTLRPRNLNNFYKEVSKYLIFTSENCSPCRKLKQILDVKEKYDLEFEYFNREKDIEIFEKFNIKSVPTIITLNKEGDIIKRLGSIYSLNNLKYIKIV